MKSLTIINTFLVIVVGVALSFFCVFFADMKNEMRDLPTRQEMDKLAAAQAEMVNKITWLGQVCERQGEQLGAMAQLKARITENDERLSELTQNIEDTEQMRIKTAAGVARLQENVDVLFRRAKLRPTNATRAMSHLQKRTLAKAKTDRKALVNAGFKDGLKGWTSDSGPCSFGVFTDPASPSGKSLTTSGPGGDADKGRLFQHFLVGPKASKLSFLVHGGARTMTAFVALYDGELLLHSATGRNANNPPIPMEWDLTPYRGRTLTIEILDEADGPWGFVGVSGMTIEKEDT